MEVWYYYVWFLKRKEKYFLKEFFIVLFSNYVVFEGEKLVFKNVNNLKK